MNQNNIPEQRTAPHAAPHTALAKAIGALKSDDPFAVARASALLTAYDAKWREKFNGFEIVEVESEFSFPLLNPETEAASRTFDEAGKIDLLVRNQGTGALFVVEHKTTSEDIAPESDYWDRLRMDTQISKYFLSVLHSGRDIGGVIYDVIRRPLQRPAQIAVLDNDGKKIVRDRSGNRVMNKDGKTPRQTGDAELGYVVESRPETPAEYEARVLAAMMECPDNFFAQREVTRLDGDILEYMNDQWSLSQQILYFRNQKLWPRNPQNCAAYGKCEMFDLCCGHMSVDTINYRKGDVVHAELKNQQATSGRELLTNSRSNALRKCARYHSLRYEEGIKRVGEESEALTFGSLVHSGLEAYFLAIKHNQQQQNQ